MRLRRAVLQIPAKSLVPPRLPVYKSRPLLTLSESTLLQVLIPLHFISFISNTYKKPGRGSLPFTPKFCNSLLPEPHPASLPLYIVASLRLYVIGLCARTATRATPTASMVYFTILWIPGGGVHTSRRLSNLNFRISSFVSPARHFPRPPLAVNCELSAVSCLPLFPFNFKLPALSGVEGSTVNFLIKELALLTVQSQDGWIHHHQALHLLSRRKNSRESAETIVKRTLHRVECVGIRADLEALTDGISISLNERIETRPRRTRY
jgi:hypothetical protein